MSSKSLVPRKKFSQEYGRHIFAYCNIRTNQVLYSLKRDLKQGILNDQLPDLGANNKPAEVRRDLWKPLWTLSFPNRAGDYRQGFDAFRRLREWRYLHEYCGEHPPDNAKLYTQKQRDELKEKLDERGGSKFETEFKIINRLKKRTRIRAIMDQKANSVADLAAVLLAQEKAISTLKERRENVDRPKEVRKMVSLADHAAINIPKLESRRQEMEAIMAKTADEIKLEGGISRGRARREIAMIGRKLTATKGAVTSVRDARLQLYYDKVIAASPESTVSDESTANAESTTSIENTASADSESSSWEEYRSNPEALEYREQDLNDLAPYVPSFPVVRLPADQLPKRGPAADRIKAKNVRLYSIEGVEIKWQNIFDAEYAQLWPYGVEHTPMKTTRRTGSSPDASTLVN